MNPVPGGLDLDSELFQNLPMSQIPLARRSPIPPENCNLARTIEIIGDRWTLLILRAALYGVRRFDDFQAELRCPRTVLSGRLKTLVDAGLTQWGDVWLGQGEPPPISFTKLGSKTAIRAAFVDPEGREVRPDQIRAVLRG
jgi:hypothetical protein